MGGDVIHTTVIITGVTWADRIRLLFGCRMTVDVRVRTAEPAMVLGSTSEGRIEPFFKRRQELDAVSSAGAPIR